MVTHRDGNLQQLQERFKSSLSSDFGPHKLTTALENVIDLISAARNQRVTWDQIVAALQPILVSTDGRRNDLDAATLRGICGRLVRRRQSDKQSIESADDLRRQDVQLPSPQAFETNFLSSSSGSSLPSKIDSSTNTKNGHTVLDDKASRLVASHRRLREIR
jgi:hypothetical protein